MQKNRRRHFVLIHGYAETPDRVWFPWLERELLKRGATVDTLRLPDPLRPRMMKWVSAAKRAARGWGPDTIVVAHSLGGVAALRAVEGMNGKISGLVLVAVPFAALVRISPFIEFFAKPIDWKSVQRKCGSVDVLQAKDDPLVPYDHALRYTEALEGKLTLKDKGGHFTGKSSEVLKKTALKHLR